MPPPQFTPEIVIAREESKKHFLPWQSLRSNSGYQIAASPAKGGRTRDDNFGPMRHFSSVKRWAGVQPRPYGKKTRAKKGGSRIPHLPRLVQSNTPISKRFPEIRPVRA